MYQKEFILSLTKASAISTLKMVLIISMFMLVKSPITYMAKVDSTVINSHLFSFLG